MSLLMIFMRLNELKDNYSNLQKKYRLPDFDEMNSAFDIGRIKRDSGLLMRDIRRTMSEKISYYMRLFIW